MMMLTTFVMSLLNPSQRIDVYDCEKLKFGRIYSLLDTHECMYNNPSNIRRIMPVTPYIRKLNFTGQPFKNVEQE